MDGIDEEARLRILAAARKRAIVRTLLAVGVVGIGIWALLIHQPSIRYFFAGGELTVWGDVRQSRATGKTRLDVQPDTYVRLENLMVTHAAEGKKYGYFFCPIYNVLVRTTRPLPDRSIRVARTVIPAGLEYLVEQRKVWVEDFATRFDAQGWIMPLKSARAWESGLREFTANDLKLSDREAESAWFLRDDESPKSHYWALIVLVAVVIVVLSSFASLLLSVRAYRKAASRV